MRAVKLGACVAACLLLAGCATTGVAARVDPTLDVQAAKAIAQGWETEIAGMVPADVVVSIDQHPKGVLMSCTPNHDYAWSGTTLVHLHPDAQPGPQEIIDIIAATYHSREDVRVKVDREEGLLPDVEIIGSHHQVYIAGPDPDGSVFRIDSWSPCFHLEDGVYPGGEW